MSPFNSIQPLPLASSISSKCGVKSLRLQAIAAGALLSERLNRKKVYGGTESNGGCVVENKETVFVTQKFDGKQIKNIYHIELSPENYFRLEILRRELNFKTIDQVINYLLAKWGDK